MDDGTINGVDPYRPDDYGNDENWFEMPEPVYDHNPYRRAVEARMLIQEAMRLLVNGGWRETVRLLDRASDSIMYSIDAAGYNSWEYARPLAGKHEADNT